MDYECGSFGQMYQKKLAIYKCVYKVILNIKCTINNPILLYKYMENI